MFELRTILSAIALAGLIALPAWATPPLPSAFAAPPPTATPANEKMLGDSLRGLLLLHMPTPIIETPHNWGNQKEVNAGVKMERLGPLRWHAVPQKAMKNDGHWTKVRVEAIDPQKSLAVQVQNVRSPEKGKTLLDAVVAMDARMTFEQQLWKSGLRAYAGETRARCRTELKLVIELTDRFDFAPGSILPDVTFRIRIAQADLSYSDLVCEHTLGLDGEAAKILGKAAHEIIKKLKPSMEADLLAKANAAIVKAADTKEVRVELSKILKSKAK